MSVIAWTGLSLALIAAPGPAREESETSVVVAAAEPPGPDSVLAHLTSLFRDALAARSPGVLSRERTKARMSLERSGPTLSECDRDFAAARARFNRDDQVGGIQAMRAVANHLENAFDAPGAYPRWSRVVLNLARAEEARGNKDEARKLMERVLRSDPSAVADPDMFPPSFVERFEQARVRLAAIPTRRIAISTGNPSARIFVEGRDLGLESATVSLAPGRYTLGVVVETVRLPTQQIEVGSEDRTLRVDTNLAGALRPSAGPGIAAAGAQREPWLAALAAWLRARHVYAVSLEGDGKQRALVVIVYDASASAIAAQGRLRLAGNRPPPGGMEALAGLLALRESSPLVELGIVSASFFDVRPMSGTTPGAPPTAIAGSLVWLPGGTFRPGAGGGTVSVDPFLIEATEVTAAAYRACVDAGACTKPGPGDLCTYGVPFRENHPINCVDWNQADAYCRWAGRRLPTPEEWEWAARGTERGYRYPWGNEAPGNRACWDGAGSDRRARKLGQATCPVGSYPRGDSPQGVKDLAGNVSEWTSGTRGAGRVDRGGAWASTNPDQLSAGHGGGREYQMGANLVETTLTVVLEPSSRRADVGMRCARNQ